jgi:hypothetical protein
MFEIEYFFIPHILHDHQYIPEASPSTGEMWPSMSLKWPYHSTFREAGGRICAQGWLAGCHGMFGATIYFADTKEAARHKSQHGEDIIIKADVNMGRAMVLEGPTSEMTPNTLGPLGRNSVKGRRGSISDWEYVVVESWRIAIVLADGSLPSLTAFKPPSIKLFPPKNGALDGIIADLTRQFSGNVYDCGIVKITSSQPHASCNAGCKARIWCLPKPFSTSTTQIGYVMISEGG